MTILHCIWNDGVLPAFHCVDSWSEHNPSCAVKVWSIAELEKILRETQPALAEVYDQFEHLIQRVNVLRVLAIFHFGGIYLDHDMEFRRPLGQLENEDLLLGWLVQDQMVGNAIIGAKTRNHPFLKLILEWQVRMGFKVNHPMQSVQKQGSGLLTNLVLAQKLSGIVQPQHVFFGRSKQDLEKSVTQHHHAMTWLQAA